MFQPDKKVRFLIGCLDKREQQILKEIFYQAGDFPKFIARRLYLPLSEVEKGIKLLKNLGLIEKKSPNLEFFEVKEEYKNLIRELLKQGGL